MPIVRLIPITRAAIPLFASLLLITTLSLLNIFPTTVKGVPNTDLKDASCNPETWVGDSYGQLVSNVLTDLVNNGPQQPLYRRSNYESDGTDTVYGFSQCNPQLLQWECASCLAVAQQTVNSMCAYHLGGTVELVDCMMRYENYRFV